MASAIFSYLLKLWPFSILKADDLKASIRLVRNLPIPEDTKQFVYAVREPDSRAVVYILAAQKLSEKSAQDAENLIKEVQPKVVVAQVNPLALPEFRTEERSLGPGEAKKVPTSAFGVLTGCLIDKSSKEQYETLAGSQVLHEIFGIGFYGHFFAAKRAAIESGSDFMFLESRFESSSISPDLDDGDEGFTRFYLNSIVKYQMVKSVNLLLHSLTSDSDLEQPRMKSVNLLPHSITSDSDLEQPRMNYVAPPFAKSVYPLFADLHGIFGDLPLIRKALVCAQKMLDDINGGDPVDTQVLSAVRNFKIAVEALRIALNNAGRDPTYGKKTGNQIFSELNSEEKCHVLFAQALRALARKYDGDVVAVIDARSLAGLRRHWNTSIPPEVGEMAGFFSSFNENVDYGETGKEKRQKGLLVDKPIVAMGAGATAALGAASLSKVIPTSTFLKLSLTHLQRTTAIGLGKIMGSVKLTVSAEKMRVVTHGLLASAKRTSVLAVRTSFYEIMRRRQLRSFRLAPWASFGCSVFACSGLLIYGDGIECAVETIPSVPMIASLGRGLKSLHKSSMEVDRTSGTTKIHPGQLTSHSFC